jgi:hypothetical protein
MTGRSKLAITAGAMRAALSHPVCVGDRELHANEAASDAAAEELGPERFDLL